MAGPPTGSNRAAAERALASAKRMTNSSGDSFDRGDSSILVETASNAMPASRRTSARRGEADARISFMSRGASCALGSSGLEAGSVLLLEPYQLRDWLTLRL